MPSSTHRRLLQEADLIRTFAQTYQHKFDRQIAQMNHSSTPGVDPQCVRLCLETVGMLLASQTRLADALRDMSNDAMAA